MNLTAVTEFDEVVKKHFLDSISLGQFEALDEKRPCWISEPEPVSRYSAKDHISGSYDHAGGFLK